MTEHGEHPTIEDVRPGDIYWLPGTLNTRVEVIEVDVEDGALVEGVRFEGMMPRRFVDWMKPSELIYLDPGCGER